MTYAEFIKGLKLFSHTLRLFEVGFYKGMRLSEDVYKQFLMFGWDDASYVDQDPDPTDSTHWWRTGGIELVARSSGIMDIKMFVSTNPNSSSDVHAEQFVSLEANPANDYIRFRPLGNGIILCGSGANRWKQVYAATATISTSDARLKTEPENVPDAVLDAWDEVNFCQFQMLDSVKEKGSDSARLHNGLIAQNIDSVFKSHGLDASRYGLFCFDSWDAKPESKDKNGVVHEPAEPAGDMYSLRYEETLCMEAAYQRRENRRLKDRVSELENKVLQLEDKLNQLLNK